MRDGQLAGWSITCLALVASAFLAFWWTESGRLPAGGDEPHYLVIAASVVRDLDFDVSNNYRREAATSEITDAALAPHAYRHGTTLWPQHMPGLGVLLAIPFGLGGVAGTRVVLTAMLIAALGMAVYRWSRTCLRPADAALATLGVLACGPVLFGASQVYPDLPAGVAVLGLAGWLWGAERRTRLGWCVYWGVAGLLCWLHVKYYAPSAVLAVLGVWRLWRDPDVRFPPATHAAFGALYAAGPVSFWMFSLPAFGNLMGGRSAGAEMNTDVARAVELFLGLHLDQVHGLFVQQPLLLPGLVALGWMIRRRHPLLLPWLVLYASLMVPNAMQQIPYGGHVAPAGRFGWSAMWLWLLPLGIACREAWTAASFAPLVRLGVLLTIVYQATLAFTWVPVPQRLFSGLFPPDVWQPSLFAPEVMLSLPKFGPHGGGGYPPNIVWTLAAFSLIAAGFLQRCQWRYLPAAATAVAALVLLPVEDTLERSRTAPRRYEAEHTPARCTVHPRSDASNGRLCRQNEEFHYAVSGPYVSLEPGRYRIVAALRQWRRRTPGRGSLQIVADRGYTFIARRDFRLVPSVNHRFITHEFEVDRKLRDAEFRVRGFRGLEVDYIDVARFPSAGNAVR